jgi:heptosyltransferase-2
MTGSKASGIVGRPALDCRHYRGDLPCVKRAVCWECDAAEPIPRRALVIKFGAPGDALRTTPLLARLRAEGYGEITWICDESSHEVLSLASGIDRLIVFSPAALALVQVERFGTVFSLDKDRAACALAMLAMSDDKRGFGLTAEGRLMPFNDASWYALRLGIDDPLKFRENAMTAPQLVFQMAGYEYRGEEYDLAYVGEPLPPPERPGKMICLNVGVGPRWPTKAWPEDNWVALARLLKEKDLHPVFVGGEAEAWLLERLAARAGCRALPPASIAIFAETLAAAAGVVSCDSLGLHVALAVRTPVVGLFCSTVSAEIEWFGRGVGLASRQGPCYRADCPNWPACMNEIRPEAILEALRGIMA